MSQDSWGDQGEPEYSDLGAPDIANDPTQLGKYTKLVGNTIRGTLAQRDAFDATVWPGFASVSPWNGLIWVQTDGDKTVWRYDGAWKILFRDTDWISIGSGGSSWVSGWSGGATGGYKAASFRYHNGVVHLTGVPAKLGTIAANDGSFILPTALRPAELREMSIRQGSALAPARVDSSGVFRVQNAGETSFVLFGSYHI